jgi:hypothetical protein
LWIAAATTRATEVPLAGPIVAELFTSQGCSSCPPAEALLGELAARPDVLPLAFHVTYWNDLGWQDTFSFAAADARQYQYAANLGRHGVYTPQMIINGGREVPGSRRKDVQQAIRAATPPATIHLSVSGGTVQSALPDIKGGCDCDLLLLGVQPSANTAVGHGENAGHVLRETNIVRQTYPLPRWNGVSTLRKQALPLLPADASLLVLLAQRRSDAQIIAVGVAHL